MLYWYLDRLYGNAPGKLILKWGGKKEAERRLGHRLGLECRGGGVRSFVFV
jgi:hypothetical protein